MFVRVLFLLLVALNLAAAAWLWLGRPPAASFPPATDPGVPELRLLSEAAPAAVAPPALASAVSLACDTLGPFTTAVDMRAAMQALSPHVARIQYRDEQLQRSHGYWVFLPAAASREAALDEARRLVEKGVHDYYVVTAGDTQNTISLGLFNDESNADGRLAQLQKLGFPARVEQRFYTETAYWVDYAVADASPFDWQAWLPRRNDLQSKPIDCFGASGRKAAGPARPTSVAAKSIRDDGGGMR